MGTVFEKADQEPHRLVRHLFDRVVSGGQARGQRLWPSGISQGDNRDVLRHPPPGAGKSLVDTPKGVVVDDGDTGKVAALGQQVLSYPEPRLGVDLAVDDAASDTELFAGPKKPVLSTARRAEPADVQFFFGVEQDDAPMT